MTTHAPSRLAAACGLAFVPAVLALNGAGSDTDPVLAAEMLALLLLVPFLAGLTAHLRDAGAARWLVLTAFGAGLTGLAVKLAGVLPEVLARRESLGPEVGPAFERLGELGFVLALPPFGIALAAVAAAGLATRALPTWVCGLAAVTAPLLVANGFALGAEFGPAFILFLAWVLAASVTLLREATAPAARPVAIAQS